MSDHTLKKLNTEKIKLETQKSQIKMMFSLIKLECVKVSGEREQTNTAVSAGCVQTAE
jgi:hypothetical protein